MYDYTMSPEYNRLVEKEASILPKIGVVVISLPWGEMAPGTTVIGKLPALENLQAGERTLLDALRRGLATVPSR